MVLHLLGKKSWNVYNSENVERVRRDEAAARAAEEAREQRMQEEDAARRVAILRGERVPELIKDDDAEPASEKQDRSARDSNQPRKRRRLRGEDETDAEIRHARQDVQTGEQAKTTLAKPGKDHDAPLLDHAGHLQLIPAPDERTIRQGQKNAEAEAEKAKKRKRDEDQYTMRFSNAAGFNGSMQQKPWYAANQTPSNADAVMLAGTQGKDVWGNEDPRRKEREQSRTSKSDPFAAMQMAQRQLKQSERDRESWKRERDEEMREVERAERRRRKDKRHRNPRDEDDGLDGFSLDAPDGGPERSEWHGQRRHKHRHRHRHRSWSRSRERERRRSRH